MKDGFTKSQRKLILKSLIEKLSVKDLALYFDMLRMTEEQIQQLLAMEQHNCDRKVVKRRSILAEKQLVLTTPFLGSGVTA